MWCHYNYSCACGLLTFYDLALQCRAKMANLFILLIKTKQKGGLLQCHNMSNKNNKDGCKRCTFVVIIAWLLVIKHLFLFCFLSDGRQQEHCKQTNTYKNMHASSRWITTGISEKKFTNCKANKTSFSCIIFSQHPVCQKNVWTFKFVIQF